MKNCKYCNEFMCGASGTDSVSEYCGNTMKKTDGAQDKLLDMCLKAKTKEDVDDILRKWRE